MIFDKYKNYKYVCCISYTVIELKNLFLMDNLMMKTSNTKLVNKMLVNLSNKTYN